MAETCLNCANPVTDNFCGNCGQKKYKRIDKKYIWDELQYTVFHTNKGFLYSVKNILKNPGKTAKDFINGNRVNHYKPILLVFVLSGIATFFSYKILNLKELLDVYFSQQKINSDLMGDMMSFIFSYNSILMLLLIPIFALTTKIAFRKWGNNYYEHIVMNSYILAFYTLISIVLVYPFMCFFRDSLSIFLIITQISFLIVPILLVWNFKEYYNKKSLKIVIVKVLGVLILCIVGYFIFIIFAYSIGLAIAALKGPEVLEYIKPK